METKFYLFDTQTEVDMVEALERLRNGEILETSSGEILTINEADAVEDALDWLTS